MKKRKAVYVLHGVADRDPKELVCVFFDSLKDLKFFRKELPGRYQVMKVYGVKHEDLYFDFLSYS